MKKVAAIKPYDLMTVRVDTSARRRVVEVISKPFPANDDGTGEERVKVRMVPGDPMTMTEVALSDLEPTPFREKRRWVQVAEVEGQFNFPEDMLRYDGAALYDHRLSEDHDELFEDRRHVYGPVKIYRVVREKNRPWTVDRWRSFSWHVEPITVYDLNKH